ncbi:MAG: PfkB family carbohydrate kinase [Candidatus Caenarcaniphilales bacterium]|nr:PfkB family carbohydrate kinase [Candidatus Caenarcaniphilales bacterium]
MIKDQLQEGISSLEGSSPNLLVVGDIILDEYLIGSPERISREAPVLILEHRDSFYRLGGAANAALNAISLGAKVCLIGLVGKDRAGEQLSKVAQEKGIVLKAVTGENQRHTTLKTRVLANNLNLSAQSDSLTSSQQVLRLDRLSRQPLSKTEIDQLIQLVGSELKQADLVLLSDYALGVLDKQIIDYIIQNHPRVIVDPSADLSRFKGAYLITPNQPDTEKALGLMLDFDSEANLNELFEKLTGALGSKTACLITRGPDGMALWDQDNFILIPAFNRAEVFDVNGAGDTVSACISVACASGLPLKTATLLGNLAASIVIRKAGAATTDLKEMSKALENLKSEDLDMRRIQLKENTHSYH